MPREVQRESAEKWLSVQFAFYMLPRQYSPWMYCVTDTFGEQCFLYIGGLLFFEELFYTHL